MLRMACVCVLLLAGCTSGPEVHTALHDDLPGFVLGAWLDDGLHYEASLTGGPSIKYREGCEHEWTVTLLHEGEAVGHEAPRVRCLGYTEAVLLPGRSIEGMTTWDGRIHDGEESEPAPPGSYTWVVRFHLLQAPGHVDVRVPFTHP